MSNLVQLYKAWDKLEEAEKWRTQLNPLQAQMNARLAGLGEMLIDVNDVFGPSL